MGEPADRYNEFAKQHGAKKEVWDENLKFRYYNKPMRQYMASIYGQPFRDFPEVAFTSEAKYQQWCVLVSGMMPPSRGREFKQFMRERLIEAEEEEIPPNMEEGIEVGVVVLTILKNGLRNCRDFDKPQEGYTDELKSAEWIFVETVPESKCGQEVFIKYEGLKARILDEIIRGTTETKLTRKEVTDWLLAHGRYYNRNASVNRWRSAYVLPLSLVEGFEVQRLRATGIPY